MIVFWKSDITQGTSSEGIPASPLILGMSFVFKSYTIGGLWNLFPCWSGLQAKIIQAPLSFFVLCRSFTWKFKDQWSNLYLSGKEPDSTMWTLVLKSPRGRGWILRDLNNLLQCALNTDGPHLPGWHVYIYLHTVGSQWFIITANSHLHIDRLPELGHGTTQCKVHQPLELGKPGLQF